METQSIVLKKIDKSTVTVEHLKKTDIGSFDQYFIDIQTFNSYWFFENEC